MKKIDEVEKLYEKITKRLIEKGLTITTMESCTSGLIASLITDTEGSSAIFPGSFVTYSNNGKTTHGVAPEVIRQHGVYSRETAAAMAAAAMENYGTHISVGITGTFGNPDPANPEGRCGEIFYAVKKGETLASGCIYIKEEKTRLDYKLETAFQIGNILWEFIN